MNRLSLLKVCLSKQLKVVSTYLEPVSDRLSSSLSSTSPFITPTFGLGITAGSFPRMGLFFSNLFFEALASIFSASNCSISNLHLALLFSINSFLSSCCCFHSISAFALSSLAFSLSTFSLSSRHCVASKSTTRSYNLSPDNRQGRPSSTSLPFPPLSCPLASFLASCPHNLEQYVSFSMFAACNCINQTLKTSSQASASCKAAKSLTLFEVFGLIFFFFF